MAIDGNFLAKQKFLIGYENFQNFNSLPVNNAVIYNGQL